MGEVVRVGKHDKLINTFLNDANLAVRKVFHGKVTYASLIWAQVEWSIFDFGGVETITGMNVSGTVTLTCSSHFLLWKTSEYN